MTLTVQRLSGKCSCASHKNIVHVHYTPFALISRYHSSRLRSWGGHGGQRQLHSGGILSQWQKVGTNAYDEASWSLRLRAI